MSFVIGLLFTSNFLFISTLYRHISTAQPMAEIKFSIYKIWAFECCHRLHQVWANPSIAIVQAFIREINSFSRQFEQWQSLSNDIEWSKDEVFVVATGHIGSLIDI